MDLMSVMIGLLMLSLCVLPFILSGRGRKKIEKRLLASLRSLASKQQTTITEYDFGFQCGLGLSGDGQHVFFTKLQGETEVGMFLPLQQYQRCRANNITRTVSNGNIKEAVLDRLELVFQPKDTKQPEETWVLYDAKEMIQLYNEMELLRKWEKRLSIVLKEARPIK